MFNESSTVEAYLHDLLSGRRESPRHFAAQNVAGLRRFVPRVRESAGDFRGDGATSIVEQATAYTVLASVAASNEQPSGFNRRLRWKTR